MSLLTRDCPHCGTKKVAFNSLGEIIKINTKIYTVGFSCSGCFGGIIAEIEFRGGHSPHSFPNDIEANPNLGVLRTYPEATSAKAPDSLPDNLSSFFLQAANNLKFSNFDASAMMSRKVLEVAVKALDPDGKGVLYKRIEKLEADRLITPDLKDWAHIVRDDGNTAAHEEEPVTKEFAEEILSFAEMFLMYTFSMPNMIKERRHDEDL